MNDARDDRVVVLRTQLAAAERALAAGKSGGVWLSHIEVLP